MAKRRKLVVDVAERLQSVLVDGFREKLTGEEAIEVLAMLGAHVIDVAGEAAKRQLVRLFVNYVSSYTGTKIEVKK